MGRHIIGGKYQLAAASENEHHGDDLFLFKTPETNGAMVDTGNYS